MPTEPETNSAEDPNSAGVADHFSDEPTTYTKAVGRVFPDDDHRAEAPTEGKDDRHSHADRAGAHSGGGLVDNDEVMPGSGTRANNGRGRAGNRDDSDDSDREGVGTRESTGRGDRGTPGGSDGLRDGAAPSSGNLDDGAPGGALPKRRSSGGDLPEHRSTSGGLPERGSSGGGKPVGGGLGDGEPGGGEPDDSRSTAGDPAGGGPGGAPDDRRPGHGDPRCGTSAGDPSNGDPSDSTLQSRGSGDGTPGSGGSGYGSPAGGHPGDGILGSGELSDGNPGDTELGSSDPDDGELNGGEPSDDNLRKGNPVDPNLGERELVDGDLVEGELGDGEPSDDDPDDGELSDEQGSVRRRASKLLIAGRVVVGLVSAVVLAAMSLVYLRVDELDSSKNTTQAVAAAQAGPDGQPPAEAPDDGANDILIVGNDSRTDMQGRPLPARVLRELRTEATETTNTDTLILLRIPRDGSRSSAISIPRDTSVQVAERRREEKINGVFGVTKALVMERMVGAGEKDRAKINRESDDAGRTSLIQAVQGLTGVRVDHYTEVSLYGFYLLTKVIDGVDVCLNNSTSDPDSGASFRKGPQVVRGGDAVAFVRQRKNLPRGDLDRIVRQQVFLSSAMRKVLSGDLLTDNTKLNALEDAVSKTVVMDGGLHFLDLVGLAQTMASGSVQFVTIPVESVGARNDRQQSIVVVDVAKVHAYVESLLTPTPQPSGAGAPATGYGLTAPAAAVAQPAVPCVD